MKSQTGFLRKILFWIHLAAGIVFGLIILTMAVTGMIMAFDKQIVEFAERDVRRVVVPENAVRFPLTTLVSLASESKGVKAASVTVFSDPAAAPYVSFGKGKGTVFINPYSGEILGGISKAHDFMHFAEDIHRRLAVKGKGEAVTGAANLGFLFLLVSGIYLWWPKNWTARGLKAVLLFNAQAKNRARDWNWHNVIGFWCAPMLLATTLTGAVMSYDWANDLLFRLSGTEVAKRTDAVKGGADSEKKMTDSKMTPAKEADFDMLFASAVSQIPAWESMTIRKAGQGRGSSPDAASITIIESSAPHRYARSQLKLDAATAELKSWEPFGSQPRGKQWRAWVRPIHTGEAWGLGGQILAFAGALGSVLLVWTGFAMAWYRFFSKKGGRMYYERDIEKIINEVKNDYLESNTPAAL